MNQTGGDPMNGKGKLRRYFRTLMSLGHLKVEKKHVEEMAALHLRTIEAMALAIEATDTDIHDHLSRVQLYAVELGKAMNLPEPDLEALRTAALLHDIGKLAVSEHIIRKPGKLTPEEFEEIKIHPIVGAEILERVQFPYAVAPIVRSHHERWDGSGYPDGLKGEEIPIGARILAVVDSFDALSSDRQYRRALPPCEAMKELSMLAGTSLDPAVVEVLQHQYPELEKLASGQPALPRGLSAGSKTGRGSSPAAGFDAPPEDGRVGGDTCEFLSSMAAAREEVQLLFELTHDLGASLNLADTLALLATRLKPLVHYDAIAISVCRDGRLIPEYVDGESFRLLSSLETPIGEGLSGWVAQTGKPILNGDPTLEFGNPGDPERATGLRSALCLPLVGLTGTLGVMTLYRNRRDAFTPDHLRILLAAGSRVSLNIDNALKFRHMETTATIDSLTNLPNARSLFLRLDSELARSKRTREPIMVLVGDLDRFKQVNERFGHAEGNKVLQAVADTLRQSCREYDYVARMGGDEFVLIFPASDMTRMRKRMAEFREIGAKSGCDLAAMKGMTMSVGEAFFPEDGCDAEQLLAAADRRMYQAKRASRTAPARFAAALPQGAGLGLIQ
jgi:diguanylate cyclase (GGDEF)-like protein/putative nucleotidyltransferase with HDIG domain